MAYSSLRASSDAYVVGTEFVTSLYVRYPNFPKGDAALAITNIVGTGLGKGLSTTEVIAEATTYLRQWGGCEWRTETGNVCKTHPETAAQLLNALGDTAQRLSAARSAEQSPAQILMTSGSPAPPEVAAERASECAAANTNCRDAFNDGFAAFLGNVTRIDATAAQLNTSPVVTGEKVTSSTVTLDGKTVTTVSTVPPNPVRLNPATGGLFVDPQPPAPKILAEATETKAATATALLQKERECQLAGTSCVSQAELNAAVVNGLREWYAQTVRPAMIRAETDPDAIRDAFQNGFGLLRQAALYGVDDEFASEEAFIMDSLERAINHARAVYSDACASGDRARFIRYLEIERTAVLLGFPEEDGPTLQQCVDGLNSNPQKAVEAAVKVGNQAANRQNAKATEKLGEFNERFDIVAWAKDEKAVAKTIKDVQQIGEYLQSARTAGMLFSRLIEPFDSKLAVQVMTAVEATVQVGEAVLGCVTSGIQLAADVALALTGNPMAIGKAVMGGIDLAAKLLGVGDLLGNLFGVEAREPGKTPDQMIMEQIQALSSQVTQVAEQMHERFDRIEQGLDAIYGELTEGFADIHTELRKIDGKVDDVLRKLDEQSHRLDQLERNMRQLAKDTLDVPWWEAVNYCVPYRQENGGVPMAKNDFLECLSKFYTRATTVATNNVALGATQRGNPLDDAALVDQLGGEYLDADAYRPPSGNEPTPYNQLEENVNYIGWLLGVRLGGTQVFTGRLPNYREWAVGSRAFAQHAAGPARKRSFTRPPGPLRKAGGLARPGPAAEAELRCPGGEQGCVHCAAEPIRNAGNGDHDGAGERA